MSIAPAMLPLPMPVVATVALEPAYNVLMSLAALYKPERYGGLDEWVPQTQARLAVDVRARHQLLFGGIWLDALTNAVEPGLATHSFPAYLAALAAYDPTKLRDTLLYWMIQSPHTQLFADARPLLPIAPARLLADYPTFATYFSDGKENEVQPRAMFDLWQTPAQLQDQLVTHLHLLWVEGVAAEWARLEPRLAATVAAFQALPLHGLTMLEVMQQVTGRDLRAIFRLERLLRYQRVRFIPHIHNGPYILWFANDVEVRIGFPAHQPPPPAPAALPFDQETLVNRYNALADETRLRILVALHGAKQLSTQEIIDRFALDKSAASRHLRQLVATSLIQERRDEGAKKCYQLNPQAIDEIIQMLQRLRGGIERGFG